MNAPTRTRRSASAAVALLLLAAPGFAAEPAGPAEGAAAEPSRESTERALEAAQQRLEAAVREVEGLSAQLGARLGDRFVRGRMVAPRAILGVQVRSLDGAPGAEVMALSPGGAAQDAGLKEGDLITAIGDTDLTKAADPGRALAQAILAQEPDRKIRIRYRRDGKSHEVEVAPRPTPQVLAFGGPRGPARAGDGMPALGPAGPAMPGPLLGPDRVNLRLARDDGPPGERGAPLAGMELATLSEKLGGYFGAREGVLVVRAGHNDAYKLQDGDVILAIDGREPNSASHATRILRSYQRGEKLQLKVMRERKTVTLDVTLPGG
jgi:S1-C subfamily serine protease